MSACSSAPPSLAPQIIRLTCQAPAPCQLPPADPLNNGDLLDMLTATEAAWATCAAKVDAVIQCNRRNHAQTGSHP
ncbi:Rz1-like lysis system protein LysC [Aeromonas jandaei]